MGTISLFVTDIWGQGQSHYLTTRAHGECQWEWSGPASVTWIDRLLEAACVTLSYLSLGAVFVSNRLFLLDAALACVTLGYLCHSKSLILVTFVTLSDLCHP